MFFKGKVTFKAIYPQKSNIFELHRKSSSTDSINQIFIFLTLRHNKIHLSLSLSIWQETESCFKSFWSFWRRSRSPSSQTQWNGQVISPTLAQRHRGSGVPSGFKKNRMCTVSSCDPGGPVYTLQVFSVCFNTPDPVVQLLLHVLKKPLSELRCVLSWGTSKPCRVVLEDQDWTATAQGVGLCGCFVDVDSVVEEDTCPVCVSLCCRHFSPRLFFLIVDTFLILMSSEADEPIQQLALDPSISSCISS